MHSDWATYLRVLLALHIACGVVAFVCAPVALSTAKGGKTHRRWGKFYFWAMAGVAVTALILSFALPIFFLAMVAVFSFYSAFAAYRILSLKDMYTGSRPKAVDWLAGCCDHGAVELPVVPDGFSEAATDGRGRNSGCGTYGQHCFRCVRNHRDAHGAGFDRGISQAANGKDVLVVWPYGGDVGQLHRGADGFLGRESFPLVRRCVVGMALADHRRRARDCRLDGVLQEAVFT
jgi:uncharacterized membrane protein